MVSFFNDEVSLYFNVCKCNGVILMDFINILHGFSIDSLIIANIPLIKYIRNLYSSSNLCM